MRHKVKSRKGELMKLKSRILWTSVSVLMAVMVSALRVIPAYADEPAPADEQPVSVENPPVEETALIEEILSEVPEGTEVVVVDQNGQAIPLATQAAAQAIVDHDPVWCP